MAVNSGPLSFLRSKYALVLTVVLAAQAAGLQAISRRENVPIAKPLAEFPLRVGAWDMAQQGVVEKEVMDVLRADDVLNRTYYDPALDRTANLFIAFFKSQRAGQTPHSPKNCLPGSGWTPSQSGTLAIAVPGLAAPIEVNRYVVSKGENQSVVLYWYQSRDRVVASEYRAKFYLVADAIRFNRTDTSLVRVVVPVRGDGVEPATRAAEQFVRAFFMPLRQFLPL